ncbi:MAG TPA: DUF2267 domain-containing protein [Bryobacteraceae bacterium]|nr:DUF2267 domain-containing protein [Bryobacteraceae bacterium]
MAHPEVFDTTLQKTSEWLRDILQSLGWDQEQRAYVALRAVLHTLRDRLPVVEAAHLGAQLPMLVRGIYYEGWTPTGRPIKWHRGEFLNWIGDHFRNDPQIDPLQVARAVFEVMAAHIDPREMRKIAVVLPAEFADLWPVGAFT